MERKFLFAGKIFTVKLDSADITDSSGYVVGNLEEIVEDMLPLERENNLLSPVIIIHKKSAVYKQRFTVDSKLKAIEHIVGGTLRTRRRMH